MDEQHLDKIDEEDGIADIYSQLLSLIGEEHTKIIFETFRGQQVTFPKRFYKTEYVVKKIREKYDGTNLKELAREFDYTDRHLRKLMFDNGERKE